jgi:phenylacetate-coenzyme A ligase PaaK-like adenylate-forming protein
VAWDAWRTQCQGPIAVAARQKARLLSLITYARHYSRFYAERYRDAPMQTTDLQLLPPVTKPELMDRFDEWATDPAITRAGVDAFVADAQRVGDDFLGRYLVFTTSGSTGVPAILVQDQRAVAVMSGIAFARGVALLSLGVLWRTLRGGGRQAAIFATGGHYLAATMLERRLRTKPSRRTNARLFSALMPLPELVRELNAFQPVILASYPSVLDLLADEQLAGRLHLAPAVLTAAGETLTSAVRARIERAFDCRVVDVYGASEAAPLALPCRRGRLHTNADWFVLEPVDAQKRPVAPGEWSHSALLTNLANYVQPIIRYELGDRIMVAADPCHCGSPLPTITVEGRTDDVLAFITPIGQTVRVLPAAIASVAEEVSGAQRLQLVQTGPAELEVRLQAERGNEDAVFTGVRARLMAFLAQQGLPDVAVRLASEPPAADPRSGKFREVWVDKRALAEFSQISSTPSSER